MDDDKPALPVKPVRPDHAPVEYDYGTGKRIASRPKNRQRDEVAKDLDFPLFE